MVLDQIFPDRAETKIQPRAKMGLIDVLLWGKTGVGKSPLLSTAEDVPELTPNIYIEREEGAHLVYQKGIEVINLAQYQEIINQQERKTLDSYEALLHLFKKLTDLWYEKKLTEKSPPFNSITFEGWTEMYIDIYDQVLKSKKSGDKEVGAIGDRNRAYKRVQTLVKRFRTIPVHLLSSAREYTFTNSEGVIMERVPHLSGQSSTYVAAQIDIVARMRTRAGKPLLETQGDSATLARDRFHKIPKEIDLSKNFSLETLWKLIRNNPSKVEE